VATLRTVRVTTALVLGLSVAACASLSSASQSGQPAQVKAGTWGGQHLAMTVSDTKVEFEFDCGTASIDGHISLKSDGTFVATGTFTREGPGPTRIGGGPGEPARVTGTVKDDTMQVQIVLIDSKADMGTFTVTLGTNARLVKCR
jgi:hypothetical protein